MLESRYFVFWPYMKETRVFPMLVVTTGTSRQAYGACMTEATGMRRFRFILRRFF